MGRPINKRFIGLGPERIRVGDVRRVGEAEEAGGNDTYIVAQKSTTKFLVADVSGGWQEILTLVDKDAGSLEEGEFRVNTYLPDGREQNLVRLRNRTMITSNSMVTAWSTDSFADSATIVNDITQANPAVLTTSSIGVTRAIDGGTITFSDNVGGMVEIRDLSSTITKLSSTELQLNDIDSTGFTAFTSGGSWRGAKANGTIQQQF